MTVEVLEEWRVIDRWWTDDPVVREYREARWGDRKVVMVREGDGPWRVWRQR